MRISDWSSAVCSSDLLRVPEISMLAAAIRTNMRYGGSISAVLLNLANILRERIRIKRELKAAISEAKISGRVLIVMPLVAMAVLVAMNPDYIDRSEEHTSELQSLMRISYAVFCLQKKKQTKQHTRLPTPAQ